MYRHLLVPIDDTDLSIEVVGNAVGLARSLDCGSEIGLSANHLATFYILDPCCRRSFPADPIEDGHDLLGNSLRGVVAELAPSVVCIRAYHGD